MANSSSILNPRIYEDHSSFTEHVTFQKNVTISGLLTVEGDITTIKSTTLEVDDINITLGRTANATNVTAEGGGITLKGATDKTIIWESEHDAWVFSENINLASTKQLLVDGSAVYAPLASPTFSGTVNATGATLNASTLTASTVAIDDSTNVATNAAVKEAIDDLRGMMNMLYVIALITAQNWSAARIYYDQLPSAQQALVTNYQTLVDGEAATIVINLITSQNWSAARSAYDGLNSAQQALVTNYQELVDAEAGQ